MKTLQFPTAGWCKFLQRPIRRTELRESKVKMRPHRRRRSARIGAADEELITDLILNMPTRIRPTWAAIVEMVKDRAGISFSRQALSAHEKIAAAYFEKCSEHRRIRNGGRPGSLREFVDDPFARQLADAEELNRDLTERLQAFEDLLIRMVQNARTFGMTLEELERPLEPRDQGRSDIDQMAKRTREARRRSGTRR